MLLRTFRATDTQPRVFSMQTQASVTPSSNLPAILYGTAWKKDRTAMLVETALRLGFRGFDTACQPKHYDEAAVGVGLTAGMRDTSLDLQRNQIYLQTKYTPIGGHDPSNIPYDPTVDLATQVVQSVTVSLQNLQTDYLDCLLLHSPLQPWTKTLRVWTAMEAQVETGKVRQLGLCNCYEPEALQDLYHHARIKPTVLQNRFYADTGFDRTVRAFCCSNRIYYQSFWTLSANPILLGQPTLKSIATAYRASPAQVLFRYLTQVHVVPLTGTTSTQHMREDLAIFDFELTPAHCQAITALLDRIAPTSR